MGYAGGGVLHCSKPADYDAVGMDFDRTKDWVPYLARPFDLFGCSVWYRWYFSEAADRVLGLQISDGLYIEQDQGVAKNYRVKGQLDTYVGFIENLVRTDLERCRAFLERGVHLNAEAIRMISDQAPMSISSATDFLSELVIHATIIPYFVLPAMGKFGIEDADIAERCEKLRAVSMYPRFFDHVVLSSARAALSAMDVDGAFLPFITYRELLAGDFSQMADRKERHDRGERFVYQNFSGQESIFWSLDTDAVTGELENISHESKTIQGRSAFPGKVQGAVRVILSRDGSGMVFNDGDILVTINSSPNLMAFIQKSGAIVTDEGGITCHAAIVSRELGKPCIIGTKIATKVLKDGDIVEVDADQGIVRILSRMVS